MMEDRVGLVGVGLMGSAMGRRLLARGMQVIAWDREPDHLSTLVKSGAQAARSPAEVIEGSHIVITMLPTAEVVLDVIEPLVDEWPGGTIWLQMSSVGAAEADRITQVATAHGITLVDAPVSGSTHPAEEGRLTILASGPPSARADLAPVLDALATRVQWVGEAGMGSRLKLAANHWMIASVAALAETMHLCEAMGLDQQQLVALLDGGPLGSPYALEKLGEMRRHEYPPGFPVRLALKDLRLVREVAGSQNVSMPVLDAVLQRFSEADAQHAEEDLAAVYELGSPATPRPDGVASAQRSRP